MTAATPGAVLPIGAAAPDFFIDGGCSGKSLALSQLSGQVVVLAFSQPGWDPARNQLKDSYNRVLSQVAGMNVRLIDIASDQRSCRMAILGRDDSLEMDIALMPPVDAWGSIAERYGIRGRSALFVVDEAGRVAWSYVAPVGSAPRADDILTGLQRLVPPAIPEHRSAFSSKISLTRRQFVGAAIAAAFAIGAPLASSIPSEPQGEGTYTAEVVVDELATAV